MYARGELLCFTAYVSVIALTRELFRTMIRSLLSLYEKIPIHSIFCICVSGCFGCLYWIFSDRNRDACF